MYIFVCMYYENQYLPSSFTYFKKLLNNGFELVLRAFLVVVVVVLINFTLLSRAATLVVVVAVVSAHIAAVTLSHIHTLSRTNARTVRNTGCISF